jgi:4'-phosphopantetheinyl transferase
MFLVLYSRFDRPLPDREWAAYLNLIPERLKPSIMRYVRWQDRHSSLIGKLLLREGIQRLGYESALLDLMQFNDFKKPLISGFVDFNITHSGEYVAVAFSDAGKVGIDVEKVHHLDPKMFANFFSAAQWDILKQAEFSLTSFFDLWTRLESVIKWEGSGVFYDLKRIMLHDRYADLDGRICNYRKVGFEDDYPCYLAADSELSNIQIEKLTFGELNEI